ncbi:MAG TPA: ABC transporter permease [Streptosporangiaceae bacterium]|nr:ABC transporter permease [Streptosporangiaceae bacterium]
MTAIPSPLGGPWATTKLQARLTANETTKGLRLLQGRWRSALVAAAGLALVFMGFSIVVGGGFDRPLMALTLPELMAVAIAQTAALQGVGGIAEEINGGTLEQSQLGPAPHSVHIAGRLAALAVEGLVMAAALGAGFALAFRLHFHLNPAVLIPALLTVADALGYGLIMTALTVRISSTGATVHVLNMAIVFFGGMLVPSTAFPHGVEIFARFVPTTLGTQVSNTILSGHPLSAAWNNGTLPWLIVHVIVLLTLGWAIYVTFMRRARREGGLSPR